MRAAALRFHFEQRRQPFRDRHRLALGHLRSALVRVPFGRLGHHQPRCLGVEIGNFEPRDLARPRGGFSDHLREQPELAVVFVRGRDQLADDIVGHDDVFGLRRVRQRFEIILPHMSVRDPLIAPGRQRERSAHTVADAVDRRAHEPLFDQTVAPSGQLGRAQESDGLSQDRGGQMDASATGVVDIARLGREIGFVGVERFADRLRPAVVGNIITRLAAGELPGRVLSLPERHDRAAVGGLVVVGEPDALDPVDAGSGDPHVPGAGTFVAAVPEPNVRRYLDIERLLRDRQLAPGARTLEPLGAGVLRWHWGVSLFVSQTGAESSIKRQQTLAAYDMWHHRVSVSYIKLDRAPSGPLLPYRGETLVYNDMLGERVDVFFGNIAGAFALYLDGKLKVLAVLDKARNAAMPDVPTSAEVALPGLLSGVWYAMVGPPKLKPELRDQIAKATIEVLKMPDVHQRFRKLNVEPDGGTPAETAAFIKNEVRRWGEVIRANHIMAEGRTENIVSNGRLIVRLSLRHRRPSFRSSPGHRFRQLNARTRDPKHPLYAA